MNIPVVLMQADGEFSVPGTRRTVNGDLVAQAARMLPMRERGEAFDCVASGAAPSENVAAALRQLVVELAEASGERNTS